MNNCNPVPSRVQRYVLCAGGQVAHHRQGLVVVQRVGMQHLLWAGVCRRPLRCRLLTIPPARCRLLQLLLLLQRRLGLGLGLG